MNKPTTWKHLEAMAKMHGLILRGDEHSINIMDSNDLILGVVGWWYGNRRKADRIMRAMIEAALREMGR